MYRFELVLLHLKLLYILYKSVKPFEIRNRDQMYNCRKYKYFGRFYWLKCNRSVKYRLIKS